MHLKITHTTDYQYSEPVSLAPHELLMRPRENHHVCVLRYQLKIEPAAGVYWSRDHNDNSLARVHFRDNTDHLRFVAEMEVETLEDNPFDFLLSSDAIQFPFRYNDRERYALSSYIEELPAGDAAASWVEEHSLGRPRETLAMLTELNNKLRTQFTYERRLTEGVQSPAETRERQSGTCRDFAYFMMLACRSLGLAARFVSGYLFDPSAKQDSGSVQDAHGGSLHAWTEVYLPGAGWKGFDPTHGILCGDTFVPLAVGRGPTNLNPVVGAFYGSPKIHSQMTARIDMEPVENT